MTDSMCAVPTTLRELKAGRFVPVAFIGGSLTVGTGASNTAGTSWRRRLVLEGSWESDSSDSLPWFVDSMIVGCPGDTLTYTFEGQSIAMMTGIHTNGLALGAEVDGKEVIGDYTNWMVEFGHFAMLAHGLEPGTHTLKLSVGRPQKKQNMEAPTARIVWLCVGGLQKGER